MTSPAWERVKELFAAAAERPPAERAAWLEAECGGDDTLRRELEELLESGAKAEGFLEEPVATPPALFLGRRLGPWRLEAEIGRGGMGAVYRGVREEAGFRQEAALKVIRGEWLAPGLTARFEQERRILARLRHPAIASLLDGGTTEDGEPWLAMEYVEGLPLDRYAEERGLSTRERLELFRTVCAPVVHAHRNLVVHRDLKPANILVTPEGAAKLLDFGIAKLIAPEEGQGAATATMLPAMTPAYASPEQVRGEPVTTASDVYSLGVVLYELLTGAPPYDVGTSAEEIVRAVCETEPLRPSAVVGHKTLRGRATTGRGSRGGPASRSELAGDLDTIVLKALRKEPERRYGSVTELTDDVRRHLEGEPVRARPDTLGYRAGKLLRRHRAAVLAAALALVSLVSGLAATVRQARLAEASRAVAERRFAEARKIANALLDDIPEELAKVPGTVAVRAAIIDRAVEYLDGLAADSAGDTSLQLELAAGYARLAALQGATFGDSLGKREEAARSLEKARALAEAAVAGAPTDPTARGRLGQLHLTTGTSRLLAGDTPGALAHLERSRAAFEAGLRLAPDNLELRKGQAGTAAETGLALGVGGRMREARDEARRGVGLFERLLADHPDDAELRELLATGLDFLGAVEEELAPGRKAGVPAFQRALRLNEALVAASPGNASYVLGVVAVHTRMAESLEDAGDLRGALASQLRAQPLAEGLATEPANVGARSNLAHFLTRTATLQTKNGDVPSALTSLARARELLDPLLAGDPSQAQLRYRAASLAGAEGLAWAALAADRRRPASERTAARGRAVERLRDASTRWAALDAEGLLVGSDRAEAGEANAQLAVLERASSSRP